MDFLEGLLRSQGKSVIFVVVDRLSKFGHFMALVHPYTAKGVAQLFVENVIKIHGMSKEIVSDRDLVFTSLFWRELLSLQGTKLKMSSTYHPQTDGQSKVLNRCLE